MDLALAARLILEMLDGIGEIHRCATDAGLVQGTVEYFAGRPYKRASCEVFMIARLLADKYELCIRRAFTEYRLRGRPV